MLPTPKIVKLAAGAAEGRTRLTAFDRALLAAGIGNLNLVKVSSILPPACEYREDFEVPPGSLTPTAYGTIASEEPGAVISAAVGLGFSHDDYGVIMEFSGLCAREAAEATVRSMVEEAFAARGKALREVIVKGAELRVERCGAVVAAAVLWY